MGGRSGGVAVVIIIIIVVVMVVVVLLEVVAIAKLGVGPVSPFEDFEEEKVIERFEKEWVEKLPCVAGETLQTRVTREDKESVFGRFDRTSSTSGEASPRVCAQSESSTAR